MVKKKRNYRHEILEILNEHGKIEGFNKLCEMGNFHRTTLHTNLDNLRGSGKIIVTTFGEKTVYSIPKSNYGIYFQKLFPEIIKLGKKIDNQTGKTKINTINKILREILVQKSSIELLLFNFNDYDIFGEQYGFLEIMKHKLESQYTGYLYELPNKVFLNTFDLIVPVTSKNLRNCRNIWNKNDFSHFRRL